MAIDYKLISADSHVIEPHDLWQRLVPDEYKADMLAHMMIKRLGTPQDLAGPLVFLLSEDAAYRLIHKKSMDTCRSMKEIAESVILMAEFRTP